MLDMSIIKLNKFVCLFVLRMNSIQFVGSYIEQMLRLSEIEIATSARHDGTCNHASLEGFLSLCVTFKINS